MSFCVAAQRHALICIDYIRNEKAKQQQQQRLLGACFFLFFFSKLTWLLIYWMIEIVVMELFSFLFLSRWQERITTTDSARRVLFFPRHADTIFVFLILGVKFWGLSSQMCLILFSRTKWNVVLWSPPWRATWRYRERNLSYRESIAQNHLTHSWRPCIGSFTYRYDDVWAWNKKFFSLSHTGFVFLFRFILFILEKSIATRWASCVSVLYLCTFSSGTVHFENYNRVEGRNGERCVGHTKFFLYAWGFFLSYIDG